MRDECVDCGMECEYGEMDTCDECGEKCCCGDYAEDNAYLCQACLEEARENDED